MKLFCSDEDFFGWVKLRSNADRPSAQTNSAIQQSLSSLCAVLLCYVHLRSALHHSALLRFVLLCSAPYISSCRCTRLRLQAKPKRHYTALRLSNLRAAAFPNQKSKYKLKLIIRAEKPNPSGSLPCFLWLMPDFAVYCYIAQYFRHAFRFLLIKNILK